MAGRSSARTSPTDEDEGRRALVLYDRRAMVDLIELTLNHGLFKVRAAASLARRWSPSSPTGSRTLRSSTWSTTTAPRCFSRLGTSRKLAATRHAGPRPHPARRPRDQAPRVRPRRRRHRDDPLLARGAARPCDRHHAPRIGHRPADRADDPARRDGDRHPQPRSAGRDLGRAPERHRAEPALPPGQPRRTGRDPRRDPRRRLGHGLRRREQRRRSAHPRACGSSSRTTTGTPGSSRRCPGRGYRFIPTYSNQGWAEGSDELERIPD